MLQGRLDEAITLLPIPFMYMRAGEILYETGQNYASAISYLQMGYNLAAQEGMAMLMLQCRIIIGNCYSNQQELENMERVSNCFASGKRPASDRNIKGDQL